MFAIFCVRFAGLACAATMRNGDRTFFPREQRIEASSGPVANQPQGLERGTADEQPISLLSVVRRLQQRPLAAVVTEVRADTANGETPHERAMLSDMGHLEDQLESWKHAENDLQKKVSEQAAALKTMRRDQAKAIHDEQIAEMVWWDCKILLCALAVLGIAFCVCVSTWQTNVTNLKRGSAESAQETQQKIPTTEAPSAPLERCEPQPEFVEKGACREAEDVLQVTLPKPPHLQLTPPTLETSPDLEAQGSKQPGGDVWQADWTSLRQSSDENEEQPTPPSPAPSSTKSQCEYFNLDEIEETPGGAQRTNEVGVARRTNEDSWWADSASAY